MSDSDIVERLRNRIHDAPMPSEHLMDEAADEIQRLQAERVSEAEVLAWVETINDRRDQEIEQLRRQLDRAKSALDYYAASDYYNGYNGSGTLAHDTLAAIDSWKNRR